MAGQSAKRKPERNFPNPKTQMLMCFVTNSIVLWFTVTRGQGMDDNVRIILVTILGLNQLYIALYQWSKERERREGKRISPLA